MQNASMQTGTIIFTFRLPALGNLNSRSNRSTTQENVLITFVQELIALLVQVRA